MKKFKNHQRPRRKYRFDIVDNKKALKIWWDSPFIASETYLLASSLFLGRSVKFFFSSNGVSFLVCANV